jgi:hypothetical protein
MVVDIFCKKYVWFQESYLLHENEGNSMFPSNWLLLKSNVLSWGSEWHNSLGRVPFKSDGLSLYQKKKDFIIQSKSDGLNSK